MIKYIPNTITCFNLICGCIAIISSFNTDLETAAIFIIIAAIFDFLDGFFARILNAQTELGKQLDSLADLGSFGIAPGIILFQLISESIELTDIHFNGSNLIPYIALAIPVASAIRLAKFNIDINQNDSFIGLPTPANAILIASIPLIITRGCEITTNIFQNPFVLTISSIALSLLLVSSIHLFSLKFKNGKWKDNKTRYIFLLVSVFFIAIFHFSSIPLIIGGYIVLSYLENFFSKKQ